ncbi:tape-measure protein [Streptomyces sp. NPDC058718]|uniref:tape-measure protein n=1 Tax=Streptomyces sp. NPDC058718 TaxID=3346610 RepID=UPI0036ABE406
MSAVAAMPNFRGTVGPIDNLLRGLGSVGGSLKQLKQGVQQASRGVGGLHTAARNAGTALRPLGQGAAAAGGSLDRIRRSTAPAGVKRIGTAAGKARTAAGKIGTGVGAILALLLPMLPVTDVIAGLMGTFGTVMTVASVAMTAVNVAMRANPLGFVVGIIVPIAAAIIEFALNSETGQQIMQQVFEYALAVIEEIWAFLAPFVEMIGTAVGTYFEGYLAVITGVITGIGVVIGGVSKLGSAVSSAWNALSGIASGAMEGVRNAVRPVVSWITESVPGFFRTAKDAVSGALRGIGDLIEGALSTVIGVVKGPINGLIAFVNWIIDGLNKLSFEIPLTGKKFGVDLDKIPMLADGGIVFPGGDADEYRIDPLSQLENRRVPALAEPPRQPHRIREFHEAPGAGPRSTAEDLLFLAAANR